MYSGDTRFSVASFSRQDEEEASIIGPDRSGAYLSISATTALVLSLLSAGCTFDEVSSRFCNASDEVEDLHEALSVLEEKGLISPAIGEKSEAVPNETVTMSPAYPGTAAGNSVMTAVAQLLFRPSALSIYYALICLGILAASADHKHLPGPSSMVFESHRSGWIVFVMLVNLVAVFMHELAHFLAARAIGVAASFGVGNRLWIVVAETNLSGIWGVPRSKRYVPLLAGCICDAVCASLLLCALYMNRHAGVFWGNQTQRVVAAITFTYFTRLLWQCFFFVRTDFYYVFATAFRCTNLMAHTQLYLQNALQQIMGRSTRIDLDAPDEEISVVRVYAWFWLVGQILALAAFFFISIPVTMKYLHAGVAVLRRPSSVGVGTLADTLGSYVLVLFPWFAGVFMWGRQLVQRRSWVTQ
jgi:putative peptide zinc metalloprotease protein